MLVVKKRSPDCARRKCSKVWEIGLGMLFEIRWYFLKKSVSLFVVVFCVVDVALLVRLLVCLHVTVGWLVDYLFA